MSKHICLVYESSENLYDFVFPYFKQGLESNSFCMWIVPRSLGVEGAKELLRKDIAGLDGYVEKGQIEITEHNEWYAGSGEFVPEDIIRRWIQREEDALRRGFRGIYVSGDASDFKNEEWEKLVAYEDSISAAIRGKEIMALCTYPLAKYDISKVLMLSFSHDLTIRKKGAQTDILTNKDDPKFIAPVQ